MKKSFALLALVPFVLFSCQKEVAQNDIDTVVPTLDNGIPTVITCDINQEATKTQYAGNQTFGWTNGDQVKMAVVQYSSPGVISQCGHYTFEASCEDGSVSAKFYNKGNDLENNYDTGDTWSNLGYLFYPTGRFNSEYYGSYPVMNLPASYDYNFTNPLNNGFVPMIGRLAGSTYKFSTAVGFVKVTLNSMSAATAKVVLESANNSIAGNFSVSLVPENENVAQILKGSATAGTSSITLKVSSVAAGSNHEFFFPLPVGSYAANDLTIKVLDSSNHVLASKTATKALTIVRNEILELPEITTPYYSVSVSGTASAPTGYFTKQNAVIFFTVTDSEETLPRSSYIGGDKFSQNGTHSHTLHNNNTGLKDTPSGLKYMHYVVAPYSYKDGTCAQVSEADIIEQDKIPFYYLASADSTKIVHKFSLEDALNPGAGQNGWTEKNIDAENNGDYHPESSNLNMLPRTFSLAMSNDISKGNIMLSELLGRSYDTSLTTIAQSSSGGTPIYGVLSGNQLTLKSDLENRFWYSTYNYYIGGYASQKDAATSGEEVSDLYATVSEDETHYIVSFNETTPYIHLLVKINSTPQTFACLYKMVGKAAK